MDSAYESALKYREFYNYAIELRKFGEKLYLEMVKTDSSLLSNCINEDTSSEVSLKNAASSIKNSINGMVRNEDYYKEVKKW